MHIIRGFPIDQFQVISTLNLDEISDAVPVSLFVEGSKLILFAVGKHQENGITVALIYNIQDKEDVVLEKKYLFHGIWSDGRINEDTGHISFLTKSLTANEYPWFSN